MSSSLKEIDLSEQDNIERRPRPWGYADGACVVASARACSIVFHKKNETTPR